MFPASPFFVFPWSFPQLGDLLHQDVFSGQRKSWGIIDSLPSCIFFFKDWRWGSAGQKECIISGGIRGITDAQERDMFSGGIIQSSHIPNCVSTQMQSYSSGQRYIARANRCIELFTVGTSCWTNDQNSLKSIQEKAHNTITVSTSQAGANPGLGNFLGWPGSKATEHCS